MNSTSILQNEKSSLGSESANTLTNFDPTAYLKNHAYSIFYQVGNYYLPQIHGLIEEDAILDLFPEYQRRYSWNIYQKSELIESFLLNIPVPSIYLYEKEIAVYEVVDGQQRLNAINEFYADKFELTGLKDLSPLNGRKYSSCDEDIKFKLDQSTVPVNIILLDNDTNDGMNGQQNYLEIRRNLFRRLNSGGTQLTPQQLRSAVYPSNFNEMLIKLSQLDRFTKAFEIPRYKALCESETNLTLPNKLYSTMEDCQIILSYFVIRENKDLVSLKSNDLDNYMEQKLKDDKNSTDQLAEQFTNHLNFLCELLGDKPFDIGMKNSSSDEHRKQMFGITMLAADELWYKRDSIFSDKLGVQERFKKFRVPSELVTNWGQTNTSMIFQDKIDIVKKILIAE